MKKIFYLASIAALAFSSCAKDETTEAAIDVVKGGSKIVAAMEADDTRTELVKDGAGYDIVWKSTDGLSVYSNDKSYALNNVLFQLDNASDGLASGAFTSQSATLNANSKYVALYPYDATYQLNPTWDNYLKMNSDKFNYVTLKNSTIEMKIPAEQIYVPGSFNTNTVAAISSNFTVGEDGNATVDMQPVVDYLMVDFVATEDIESIQLQLLNATTNEFYVINGAKALDAYVANDAIRYYLPSDTEGGADAMDGTTITALNTKNLSGDVSLAEANTYVFVVPAGILGADNNVKAVVHVNEKIGTDWEDNVDRFWNTANINYAGPSYAKVYRKTESKSKYTLPVLKGDFKLENMVFHMNAINPKTGKRVPFEYNPNGDYTIYDELDLIDFLISYDGQDIKDAYVAEGATFDLSISNLSALLREEGRNVSSELRTAINDYIMAGGKFPTIAAYDGEFKGNGATIANIERPLAGMGGLFGKLTGTVNNLTLSNIVAASVVEGKNGVDEDYNGNGVKKETVKGVILASSIDGAISNITVSKLDADAVVGEGSLDNYNNIKIGEAGIDNKLNHIMQAVAFNNNLTLSAAAWAAVAGVNESVFHTIVPDENMFTAASNYAPTYNKYHNVATLPAGAKYEKFVMDVDADANEKAVSVVIDGVSYWTGDTIEQTFTMGNYTSNGMGYYNGHIGIMYAEQLAANYTSAPGVYVNTDIDMNYAHNKTSWTAPTYADFAGAGATITGLTLVADLTDDWNKTYGSNSTNNVSVAPFTGLKTISDVTFDGLTITIVTGKNAGQEVPKYVSGIAVALDKVDGVTVNDLVINACSDLDKWESEANYTETRRYIGWISAEASDIAVYDTTVNGVDSNVIGLSGMIGRINLNTNNTHFDGSTVTGKISLAKGQTNISAFEVYNANNNEYNTAGSHVALVINSSSPAKNVGIKFDDFGSKQPVFLYETPEGNVINVLYNDKVAKTLLNPEDEE